MDEELIYIDYTLDINNNELKIKDYETEFAKYQIATSEIDANHRSVVICPETKQILCFSPPLSQTIEEFKEKNPIINDTILLNEIIEGTMLNLFYDPRINLWEIGTKGAIGGNYWFFRNQYSVGNEFKHIKQPTFRQMFLEVFQSTKDLNKLPILEFLPKEYCYSFVLQHPANHIVNTIEHPVLYLTAVYHLIENKIVYIPPTIFEEWDCFIGVRGLIEFPRRYDEESYDEIKLLDNIVGIMFTNISTGDRACLENPIYKTVRELRGNHPNIHYHYLCLRNEGKVDEFLQYFPQYKDLFYQFYKNYNDFVTKIHQNYVLYYVQKSGIKVPKKYFSLIYKIHHEVFLPSLTTEKLIIRRGVVGDFIRKMEPKSLIYYLNQNE
jgi:hypothetical protein